MTDTLIHTTHTGVKLYENDMSKNATAYAKSFRTAFSWHRLSGRWVTGIDLRHYEHYQEIKMASKRGA